ncbi:ribonuclease E/G [Caulobacter sp. S45]|uniref:ribonuclease E/G n=1 Tax=Caulobacter sp. S45 TaxID=1641861 RepID=UPI001576A187|nr:ribonuclease E/G [Caulobacter sp. S45]
MAERCAFLDRAPGEVRAVVMLDGSPERLLIWREDDITPRLGARYAARVEAVSERMGLARLELGGPGGALRLRGLAAAPHVGERLQVEVVAEPVREKPAALRLSGLAPGSTPGLLSAAPTVEQQLTDLGFKLWTTGDEARELADAAQAAAIAAEHVRPDGVTLTVQPTRALTAVDVDLAETGGSVSVSRANLSALAEAARLLRLKALGGLVAIDLIGFPKNDSRLQAAARDAFAPDGPEVVIAPVSRFGVMELAKPHLRQPLHEQLVDKDGQLNARTAAQAVVRALERQGRFDPGSRLVAVCPPEVAVLAAPWVAHLGPRFSVRVKLGAGRSPPDICTL